MPSFSHHTDSADSPPAPVEPNGVPLSERIAVWQADVLENPLHGASDAGPRRIDDAHLHQKAAGLDR